MRIMGMETLSIIKKDASGTNGQNRPGENESENNANYFISPELSDLSIEIRKEKKDNNKIWNKIRDIRNKLVVNRNLLNVSYEELNEEFEKFLKNYNKADQKELFDYVKQITANASEKEETLRKKEQEDMEKRGGKILNQLMVYNFDSSWKDPKIIAIHISPNKTLSSGKKLVLLRDGFRQLAEIVKNNPTIQSIEGESWIIRDYPEIVKKMGFKIQPQIFTHIKEFFERTPKQLKAAGIAKISRKDFLERYSNK